MNVRDPYKILKLKRDASPAEIQSAYRKLVMMHHPDRRPGDAKAAEQFKEIQWAWEILGSESRKRRFDETGDTAEPIPEDREHLEMLSFLITVMHGALSGVLNGTATGKCDVVAEMHRKLSLMEFDVNEQLATVRKHQKAMADAASRFIVLEEGSEENFLAVAAKNRLAEIDAVIPGFEAELVKLGKAKVYLKKFGYKLDQEPQKAVLIGRGASVWFTTRTTRT